MKSGLLQTSQEPNVSGLVLHTYLNLISLLRLSITVAPPKECPITAILLVSTESCQKNPGAVRDFPKLTF